ncbi:hypothetical protein [Endozoicomonas ascidiicola]|uniref:hypothetical protein n=1 Tax=Endozoicomonas ascidiicola TaxID=1698521 RepID=UPI00082DF6B8|nr:hypothetical protein [Endozoicomonas ascidiicola]
MQLNIEKPERVYLQIEKVVGDIVHKLSAPSDDESIEAAKSESRQILKDLQSNINKQLSELRENADWETFTIAFYGETNAGKSTLIESLRILLKEASKMEEQRKFKEWESETEISDDHVETLRQEIDQLEEKIEQHKKAWINYEKEFDLNTKSFKRTSKDLKFKIKHKKKGVGFWQRVIWLFRPFEEQVELKEAKAEFKEAKSERTSYKKNYSNEALSLKISFTKKKSENQKIEKVLSDAIQHADGGIIGNGRSDYTLDTQRYLFTSGSQKFAILDVPGIEGNETKVVNSIWSAVKKAHAVFYVTSKAAPPQKGDDNNSGTLEKIKAHLGAQTEVWSIYNKRITNPMQLEKPEIISDDEKLSLEVLNQKMQEQLGDNYQRCLSISAYPAFLASSTCLVPASQEIRNQKKFLTNRSREELLERTNMQSFLDMLTGNMVSDSRAKIERSNINKAHQVISGAHEQVFLLQKEKFIPLLEQLKNEVRDAEIQLDAAVNTFKARLSNTGRSLIEDFKRDSRKEVYAKIEKNISNDEFKTVLKNCITKNQEKLSDKLPSTMKRELRRFENNLKDIIKKLNRQTGDLLKVYKNVGNTEIELNIDLKNGINTTSLLMSIIGGGLLFWNPAGWFVLAPALATLVFQVYKAVRSFFSSSYKMAQQKKSVDENLDRVESVFISEFDKGLSESMRELSGKISEIKEGMQLSIGHIFEINQSLKLAEHELSNLSDSLEYTA